LKPLGSVWWICERGTEVWWHYATPTGDARGIANTQRNAVARLRELANAKRQIPLPLGPEEPAAAAPKARAAAPKPAPKPAPVVEDDDDAPQPFVKIAWDDHTTSASAPDLAAELFAALQRQRR
jgi:hypothetical protein